MSYSPIGIYKNVFTKEWCDKAIRWFNISEELGDTVSRQERDGVLSLDKKDDSIIIPHDTFSWEDEGLDFHAEFKTIFFSNVYPLYKNENPILETMAEHYIRAFKLQKTLPGGGYHVWHCEQASRSSSNRLLAWILYLNEDFEAGETEFLNQGERVKPEVGTVCIFPASFTHVHRGNPPIGGAKYIATGWLEF